LDFKRSITTVETTSAAEEGPTVTDAKAIIRLAFAR
jgi:hypothetical protein